MSEVKKNIPALRFPEFSEEWEKKKLGQLLTFKNGVNATKEQYGKGVKFINVLDIIENNFITHDNIKGLVDIEEKEFLKNEVKYGDILFQRSSETREEVGQANVYLDKEKSATFGGFVIRGQKTSDYDPMFMNYLLKGKTARKEITTKSGGSTRYNVGQDILTDVSIKTTTLPEQQKIATFLSSVDKKIGQLTEKKELLEEYKKGVMQKIFSREIRFKKEDGSAFEEWEERKLGELLTESRIKGDGGDKAKKLTVKLWGKGVFPKEDKTEGSAQTQYFIRKSGQFIYSKLDFLNCAFGIIPDELDGLQSTVDLPCFDIKTDLIHPYFLLERVKQKNFYKKFGDTADGSRKAKRIHANVFFDFFINLPSIPEQQKIANFLTSLDRKIETVGKELEGVKEWKKGLLQGMFV
ncbi:restriction endonuclease subunit S [Flammeovirga sp. OC4]|uniref:restriction endonuclease subunit S n=1 Tax=Flammeovirga sp. OC4 TaxID=1382345 RepID=UPI0005C6141B|nr:restriction endonuclease subunit S [Flammeovirga sp. OC4]